VLRISQKSLAVPRKGDDFGAPTVAFTVCTLWYVNALAAIGRREKAPLLAEVANVPIKVVRVRIPRLAGGRSEVRSAPPT